MGRAQRKREDEQAGGRSAIRLFVDAALEPRATVALAPAQSHYLRNVMRQAPGDRIRLFNGRDGEWEATIETVTSGAGTVRLGARLAAQTPPAPDVRLLFAPLKITTTRFVVQKATELGVGAIHPVFTRHGQARRINTERLRTHAIEAAEQCGRLDVPEIAPPCPLTDVLAAWPSDRRLLFCDPGAARPVAEALAGGSGTPWAILIGPEGGFAPEEQRLLSDHPATVSARLGPRTLCAETAAAAALAYFQALAGDWR